MPGPRCHSRACAESIGTSVSSAEREKEKPAAQNRLGMGALAALARRLPLRRSMPSGPKWLARSRVGLSSSGTLAPGPRPWEGRSLCHLCLGRARDGCRRNQACSLRRLFLSGACLEGQGVGSGDAAVLQGREISPQKAVAAQDGTSKPGG